MRVIAQSRLLCRLSKLPNWSRSFISTSTKLRSKNYEPGTRNQFGQINLCLKNPVLFGCRLPMSRAFDVFGKRIRLPRRRNIKFQLQFIWRRFVIDESKPRSRWRRLAEKRQRVLILRKADRVVNHMSFVVEVD